MAKRKTTTKRKVSRKRTSKFGFNTHLMLDIIGASLIVQKAPALIDSIIQLPEQIKAFAGAGAGYLLGTFLKRSDLANASIALGVVDFVSPMVDQVIGSTGLMPPSSSVMIPVTTGNGNAGVITAGGAGVMISPDGTKPGLSDYMSLNDYIKNPSTSAQDYSAYSNSY